MTSSLPGRKRYVIFQKAALLETKIAAILIGL